MKINDDPRSSSTSYFLRFSRLAIVAAALNLFPASSFSQTPTTTTWNGLHFGMTVEEAKEHLSAKGIGMIQFDVPSSRSPKSPPTLVNPEQHPKEQNGHETGVRNPERDRYRLSPSYAIDLQKGVISSLLFTVELEFNHSGLNRIAMELREGRSPSGAGPNTLTLASFVPQELHEAITSKYGKPVNREGQCDNSLDALVAPVPKRTVTCETTWKTEGQVISSFWAYSSVYREVPVQIPGKKKPKLVTEHDEIFVYRIYYSRPVQGL